MTLKFILPVCLGFLGAQVEGEAETGGKCIQMNRVVGILVEIVPLSSPVCDETSRVKEHF